MVEMLCLNLTQLLIGQTIRKISKALQGKAFEIFLGLGLQAKRCNYMAARDTLSEFCNKTPFLR
ncbi:MAG: hypothetical protein AUK48_00960 [Oscillatoriales cyanobacterium CG2_30_44_21]|nr:MAG: hypothetical protein AUK48_00960 [Oscillatoriales cyanobacterium CG2_30_44_21]